MITNFNTKCILYVCEKSYNNKKKQFSWLLKKVTLKKNRFVNELFSTDLNLYVNSVLFTDITHEYKFVGKFNITYAILPTNINL